MLFLDTKSWYLIIPCTKNVYILLFYFLFILFLFFLGGGILRIWKQNELTLTFTWRSKCYTLSCSSLYDFPLRLHYNFHCNCKVQSIHFILFLGPKVVIYANGGQPCHLCQGCRMSLVWTKAMSLVSPWSILWLIAPLPTRSFKHILYLCKQPKSPYEECGANQIMYEELCNTWCHNKYWLAQLR